GRLGRVTVVVNVRTLANSCSTTSTTLSSFATCPAVSGGIKVVRPAQNAMIATTKTVSARATRPKREQYAYCRVRTEVHLAGKADRRLQWPLVLRGAIHRTLQLATKPGKQNSRSSQ